MNNDSISYWLAHYYLGVIRKNANRQAENGTIPQDPRPQAGVPGQWRRGAVRGLGSVVGQVWYWTSLLCTWWFGEIGKRL
jgi:hypothetical protein